MRFGYYLYGVFTYVYWAVASFVLMAHTHGKIGYKHKKFVDDFDDEELGQEIERTFNEW